MILRHEDMKTNVLKRQNSDHVFVGWMFKLFERQLDWFHEILERFHEIVVSVIQQQPTEIITRQILFFEYLPH